MQCFANTRRVEATLALAWHRMVQAQPFQAGGWEQVPGGITASAHSFELARRIV